MPARRVADAGRTTWNLNAAVAPGSTPAAPRAWVVLEREHGHAVRRSSSWTSTSSVGFRHTVDRRRRRPGCGEPPNTSPSRRSGGDLASFGPVNTNGGALAVELSSQLVRHDGLSTAEGRASPLWTPGRSIGVLFVALRTATDRPGMVNDTVGDARSTYRRSIHAVSRRRARIAWPGAPRQFADYHDGAVASGFAMASTPSVEPPYQRPYRRRRAESREVRPSGPRATGCGLGASSNTRRKAEARRRDFTPRRVSPIEKSVRSGSTNSAHAIFTVHPPKLPTCSSPEASLVSQLAGDRTLASVTRTSVPVNRNASPGSCHPQSP